MSSSSQVPKLGVPVVQVRADNSSDDDGGGGGGGRKLRKSRSHRKSRSPRKKSRSRSPRRASTDSHAIDAHGALRARADNRTRRGDFLSVFLRFSSTRKAPKRYYLLSKRHIWRFFERFFAIFEHSKSA